MYINDISNHNQLTLNLSKICYTIFGRHLHGTRIQLLLQGKQIELVKSPKYVGILYTINIVVSVLRQRSNLLPSVFIQFYKPNSALVHDRMQIYVYQHIKIGLERT